MGGMGEKEIVIMYHYVEDKVFLKDMKYLCSNIINQLVTTFAIRQKKFVETCRFNELLLVAGTGLEPATSGL